MWSHGGYEDDYGGFGNETDEMFQLEKIELPFITAASSIRQLKVGNEILAMIIDDTSRRRWQVFAYNFSSNCEPLLQRSMDDDVHNIFIDPNGAHVLISLKSGENHHANLNSGRTAICKDLSGIVVESVGWDKSSNAGTPVLFGDTRGRIHEARLDRHGFKLTGKSNDSCVTDPPTPVSCLSIERFDNGKGFLVIATCATSITARLFQLVGSTLENVITNTAQPFLREMPGTRSELQLYRRSLDQSPVAFAWSTESGILHGKMNFSVPQETVLDSETVMYFDNSAQGGDPSLKGILISEYHFFLLHADRIQVIAQPPGFSWMSKTGGDRLKPSDLKGRTIWSKTFSAGIHNEGRRIVKDLKAQKFYIHSKVCVSFKSSVTLSYSSSLSIR